MNQKQNDTEHGSGLSQNSDLSEEQGVEQTEFRQEYIRALAQRLAESEAKSLIVRNTIVRSCGGSVDTTTHGFGAASQIVFHDPSPSQHKRVCLSLEGEASRQAMQDAYGKATAFMAGFRCTGTCDGDRACLPRHELVCKVTRAYCSEEEGRYFDKFLAGAEAECQLKMSCPC